MNVVDANVLIYSVNADARHHRAARQWMDTALSGSQTVVLPWLCLLAFLRITTHPRIYDHPLTVEQALDAVDDWLNAPPVRTDLPAHDLPRRLRQALEQSGVGGNSVNDAYLAALALGLRARLISFDTDFARFSGLVWVNPTSTL